MAKARKAKAKKPAKKKAKAGKAKAAKSRRSLTKSKGANSKAAKSKKAAARKPAKKAKKPAPKKKQKLVGEGDYAATRAFDKDQAAFVKRNKAKIPQMGREAERALDGPEGNSLRAAEQEAMDRSTID